MSLPTDTAKTLPFIEVLKAGIEPAIRFNQAVKLKELQVDGRAPALGLLYRKARQGHLDHAVLLGGMVTSREAVHRMLDRMNDPGGRAAPRPTGQTPRRMAAASRRAHLAAVSELSKAGFFVPPIGGAALHS